MVSSLPVPTQNKKRHEIEGSDCPFLLKTRVDLRSYTKRILPTPSRVKLRSRRRTRLMCHPCPEEYREDPLFGLEVVEYTGEMARR